MQSTKRLTNTILTGVIFLVILTDWHGIHAQAPAKPQIVFASDRDGDGEIYLMDIDGSNQVNITRQPAEDWDPAWSPDGTTIAFSSNRGGRINIYLMDADGGKVRKLFRDLDFGLNMQPTWSPDGRQIAFAHRDAGGGFLDIYVTDVDGRNPQPITKTETVEEWLPSWSPDGKKIAFASLHYVLSLETIDVFDAETKQVQTLVHDSFNSNPSWSPDGRHIIFERGDGIRNIYIVNRDGGNLMQITDNPGPLAYRNPEWSPDGRSIVYEAAVWKERKSAFDFDLFIMNADGSNPRQLTQNIGLEASADWFDAAALSVSNEGRFMTTWGRLKQVGKTRK